MPVPLAGAPNVLVVLLDDIGCAAWSPYGGRIRMPVVERLATTGLMHSGLPLSPVGDARLAKELAGISAVLRGAGWSTCWSGDRCENPADAFDLIAPRKSRSSRFGFDRVYDALHAPGARRSASDIADDAIEFIGDVARASPLRPWYLYVRPSVSHAAPRAFADRYRGAFDDGYDAYREWARARMSARGLLAGEPARAPSAAVEVQRDAGRSEPRAWSSLGAPERRRLSRMAEEYAALSEYTDAQVGRIVDHLERSGQLTNTVIFYGAGGRTEDDASLEQMTADDAASERAPVGIAASLATLAELVPPEDVVHCPPEWAAAFALRPSLVEAAPERDVTMAPLVVHWPRRIVPQTAAIGAQHHRADLAASILECCGLTRPARVEPPKRSALRTATGARTSSSDVAVMRFTRRGEGDIAPVTGRYAFYPNSAERVAHARSHTHGRTFKLFAAVETTGDADGVICSQETRFGSYALVVRDGTLCFDHGAPGLPSEERLRCDLPAPGRHVVGVELVRRVRGRAGGSTGAVTLYVDGEPKASAPLGSPTTRFGLCGEGLAIGRDGDEPFSAERRASRPLVGAQVIEVVFDVAEEACADDEHEEAAATHG